MTKVQRWEIPLDELHSLTFKGELSKHIGYVEATPEKPAVLEVWSFEYLTPQDPAQLQTRQYQVFGTDVEVPPGFVLIGSTPQEFHLFEKMV